MRNYFKKFSIMFVMALAIIGIGMIQNGSIANAATVGIGERLSSAENGWNRYDDSNKYFIPENCSVEKNAHNLYYKAEGGDYIENTRTGLNLDKKSKFKFRFYGDKFRIISDKYHPYRINEIKITIDGSSKIAKVRDNDTEKLECSILQYESELLVYNNHDVIIEVSDSQIAQGIGFVIDAIDIKGQLIPYDESITLDKSTINVTEGDSDKLLAITTPSAVGVTWTVSDSSIATIEVDPTNGKITKVNAIKEGTCTITATTADGSNLSASCTINVTKKDVPKPDNPTTDSKTGAILIINLTDGETKVFDVSSSEVDKFKYWYNNKSEFENKLTYVFNKTVNSTISVEEDVVHNQITSFEIRKY